MNRHPTQHDSHRQAATRQRAGKRSLLQHSALLRGLWALALCGALATVLVWATRPMA
ncbi:MAG: hypothetical protein U1A81_09090 [Hydrogenophaga sp.]|nr:hypothetical protein [Hydrogenophaga sp.]MDP3927149.1 hypothetical protein [Hydrogenophaga sp.]MDZ4238300.1 hypothetical protein [Hydrogenophaga sp.]